VHYLEEGTMSQIGAPLVGFYDVRLVALSILVAILSSYVVLDLAVRVTAARGGVRYAWLAGGAISMGLGFWSMHFVGMLAFKLPIPVRYDVPTVLISLLAAILASAVALYVASGQRFDRRDALVGGLVMGSGIASMHYLGMAAMRLSATSHYNPLLVGLSIVIAVVASLAALTFGFDSRGEAARTIWTKVASPCFMGIFIACMHYVGMASASFANSNLAQDFSRAVSISRLGVTAIVTATLLVSASTLWTSLETRRFTRSRELANVNEALRSEIAERKLAEEAVKQAEDRLRLIIDTIPTMAWSLRPDGTLDYCNERWRSYMGLGPEELQGDGWQSTLHPGDRHWVLNAWHESVVDGTPYEQEERHRGADGTYRWFLSRGLPLRDAEGHIVRWYGTNTDIEDRKQAEGELRRLSGQLLRSQDEERRRIARDLHDSTGQDLVALATMLGQLRGSIPSVERKSRRLLSECKALADKCIRDVRTLSYVLHPPVLDEAGLGDAIRDYVKGFTKRSGIQVELELSPRVGRMARDVELALFRVVQESLTNIQRHSGSERAKIRIHRNSDLTLEISDLGRGVFASVQRGKEEPRFEDGVGIPSMQERVKLIGGRLEIASSGHGTTVRVTIPLGRERT
jgi:PAS domain S-box-containing protein